MTQEVYSESGINSVQQEEREFKITTIQTVKEVRTCRVDCNSKSGDITASDLPVTVTTTTTTYEVNGQVPVANCQTMPNGMDVIPKGRVLASVTSKVQLPLGTGKTKDNKQHLSTSEPIATPRAMQCASQKLHAILNAFSNSEVMDRAVFFESVNYAISVLDYNYQAKPNTSVAHRLTEKQPLSKKKTNQERSDKYVRNSELQSAGSLTADKNADGAYKVIKVIRVAEKFLRVLYRITIPDELKCYLKKLFQWDFDVFELHRVSGGHSLRFICLEALSHFGVCSRFKIRRTVMEQFLNRLEEGKADKGNHRLFSYDLFTPTHQGYCINRNPYHNALHGADVIQGTICYLAVSNLTEWLSELERFAVIIAAAVHDFEHTGTTNGFHVNVKSNLALFYNDRSILENYHVSAVFRFMATDPEMSIVAGLSQQEYKEMRALLIDIVLNTDMQFHSSQIQNTRLLLAEPTSTTTAFDKAKVLSLMVHSADISHPGRPWPLHERWSKMLCQEFFNQGDQEKAFGMAVSPLCDRATTKIASSQIGFIDFVVAPTFEVTVHTLEYVLNSMFQKRKILAAKQVGKQEPTKIAYQCDYSAAEKELGDQSCEYIPFMWDGRNDQLKIHRFYARHIEHNKAMWQRYVEVEDTDPMYFKRFERDPVVEIGWPIFDKGRLLTIEEKAYGKEKSISRDEAPNVREARKKVERYKRKLKAAEGLYEECRRQ